MPAFTFRKKDILVPLLSVLTDFSLPLKASKDALRLRTPVAEVVCSGPPVIFFELTWLEAPCWSIGCHM